ncbi:MAG: PIG-L family deacetylase [Verrucomicrobiota bacterium]
MSARSHTSCFLFALALGAGLFWPAISRATESIPASPPAIRQELRSFGTVATLLHIAAHPDDENTALITYFALGRGYRTAYLSLTRGDGGQNEIGPEFDEKLGVARTQELLAARRLDGGRQFFTRAIDFGFSKTPEETLRFWDREQVLSDVVRIIRQYRPDVIVTRFPIPPGSGGHGHHTASGILGVEAFKLAGDTNAFPEHFAQGLSPWQPTRVVWNGGGRGGESSARTTISMDIGGNDPVSGESFGAIAGRSRAMHITQGFNNFGGRGGGGPNVQTFVMMGGEPATTDLFEGIRVTWSRFPGCEEIESLAQKALADFNAEDPAAIVPLLLKVRAKLAAVPINPVISDKRAQLDRILQACLGLSVETTAAQPEMVPEEETIVRHTVSVRAKIPVKWIASRGSYFESRAFAPRVVPPGPPQSSESVLRVPSAMPITQPYWLREEGSSGIFRVDDPQLIGTPQDGPAFPLEHVFEIEGQQLIVKDEPFWIESIAGHERRRRLDVVPPVSLRFGSEVSLFRPGSSRSINLDLTATRPGASGMVRLEAPPGWKIDPVEQAFRLARAGDAARHTFQLTAPEQSVAARLTATVTVGGRRFSNQRIEINYPHLPLMLLQPAARVRLVSTQFETRGKSVGYLPGAGTALPKLSEKWAMRCKC